MRKADLLSRVAELETRLAHLTSVANDSRVGCPDSAVARLRERMQPEQETFVALLLDARQKIVGSYVVGMGSVSAVTVHPRDVFRETIRRNAHSLIVGHNHPSGVCEPSQADDELTDRLIEAGKLLGIPVLDHIVVTDLGHYSYAERGRM